VVAIEGSSIDFHGTIPQRTELKKGGDRIAYPRTALFYFGRKSGADREDPQGSKRENLYLEN